MDITSLIQQYCIPIIAVVVYCICFAIKKAQVVKDKYIPLIAIALGGISGFLLNGLSYESIAMGIVSGASATCFNQIIKQFQKDDGYSI